MSVVNKPPRIVACIEARMGSSRLPGKVLADVMGQPAMTRLINRLRHCKFLDDIVIATTKKSGDDALEVWAKANGVLCHRGSEDDVLQRVVDAADFAKADVIVEITGDCILTDPEIIDMGVETFLLNDCDVVSNCGEHLSYPMGVYVQVFRAISLQEVAETIYDPAVREHVSLYFYEHPERYRIINMIAPPRWKAPEYRFQLDYKEDLTFLREVYKKLEPKYGDAFGVEEIMALIKHEPQLVEINIHCEEKSAR